MVGMRILEEEEQTMHALEPYQGKTAAVDKEWLQWKEKTEDSQN